MRGKAVFCVPLGHRWRPIQSETPYPLLVCQRCGRHREGNAGSGGLGGRMDQASKYIDVNIRR